MRSYLLKLTIVLLIISCLFTGCQAQPSGEITVTVIVSRDFGNESMLDEIVIVNAGASAMEALEKVAVVETEYGGGFVKAINGVASKAAKDWFFYINGISANVGALNYKLHDGDVEHWDFHDWGFRMFIPAIISDFPQPFVGGYQGRISPTVVVYDEGFQDIARDSVNKLEELGVENIRAQAATDLSMEDKQRSNLILLGTEDFALISELNENYEKLGLYIYFENGKVKSFSSRGDEKQYSNCGLIQATQNPWRPIEIGSCGRTLPMPMNVVWVISGTDETQVRSAIDMLTNRYEEFRCAYAAVIIGEEIIKVPQ